MGIIESAIGGTQIADVDIFVPGIPGTQGSKSFKGMFRSKKTGRMVPILMESAGDKLASWRQDIREGLTAGDGNPVARLEGRPVLAVLHFTLTRPKSTPKTRTPLAVKKPDLDKLQRAVFDAMKSAGVYNDDSQIVACYSGKRLAEPGETTGCLIRLFALDDVHA